MEAKGADESSSDRSAKSSKDDLPGSKGGDDDTRSSAAGSGNAAEASPKPLGDRELISAVCGFIFDSEDLQNELEKWATLNAKAFSPMDREYTLEQTALFNEFRDLFEARLERFLSGLCVSIDALYRAIQADKSTDFHSGNTLVAVINAAVDFKNFHVMMCDARAGEFIWGMPPLQDDKTGELFCDR